MIRSRALSSFAAMFGLAACTPLTPAAGQSAGDPADLAVAIALDDTSDFADLEAFGRAVGERRIVLLGENGHGVREFTLLKSRLVRYLHERKGFDVLVFEAPLYECADVYARLGTEPLEQSMRECLLAPMHHAELRPLFEYVAARRNSSRPLELAGSDIQSRGWGPIRRPDAFRRLLQVSAPALAATIAQGDSTLTARQRLGVDSLRPWILMNGPALRAAYDSAAAMVDDPLRQWLRSASALISRELLRSTDGSGVHPPPFYEIRDEWMARNILWAADSQGTQRKVVVWLHNDHARYGSLAGPSGPVRATGSFLQEWRPEQVYSAGFLHGAGQVTSNSRRILAVSEFPAGSIESTLLPLPHAAAFLDLRSGPDWFRTWGAAEHLILRAGMTVERLRPAVEFDALFWVRSAHPPSYRLARDAP